MRSQGVVPRDIAAVSNVHAGGMAMGKLQLSAPLEIGFCTRDLASAMRFWQGTLGLEEVSRIATSAAAAIRSGIGTADYTVVRLQLPTGERVKIFAPSTPAAAAAVNTTPLSRVGFAFLTLIVEDLDQVLGMLTAAGFAARQPASELRPGVHVALVDDPDGNVVELVQYSDITAYRPDRAPLPERG
jgi:catechol 2,3-dioxygenase-like lactoylglutathione lyase family enzyme